MDELRRVTEINRRQRHDNDHLGQRVPQHRLPPAEVEYRALEYRRPQCAGQIAAARDQRQRRTAPAIEPAADIDVERCIDAAEADQADEQPVSDPERPGRSERRYREPKGDHQRTEYHGPARADPIRQPPHQNPAGAGPEPGQRARERRNRARAADFGSDVLERHRDNPRRAERHRHDAQGDRGNDPGRTAFDGGRGRMQHQCEPGFPLLPSAEDSTTRAVGRAAPHMALQRLGCAHRSREYLHNDAKPT